MNKKKKNILNKIKDIFLYLYLLIKGIDLFKYLKEFFE
jgi:hypothetical protein